MNPYIQEVEIEGIWSETEIGKKRFLLAHRKGTESIIIFCSDEGLRLLSLATRWHSDGTFDATPAIFYQLYIIHAYYTEPFEGKTEAVYREVLV